MAVIRWTKQALNDIDSIANYIAIDSSFYAKMFVKRIFEVVKHIETFPQSGRVVPEIDNDNIREVLIGNYRIIYRTKNALVEILTIYHSARLLTNIKN